jgi:hypothetical protein
VSPNTETTNLLNGQINENEKPPAFWNLHVFIQLVWIFIQDFKLTPETWPYTAWRITAMVAAVVQAVVIPYQVAFQSSTESSAGVLEKLAWAILIIDIIFGFRTAYVNDDGQIISQPREMARHYLRGPFFLDFIANFPLEVFDNHVAAASPYSLNRTISLYKAFSWIRHEEMKLTGSLLIQAYKFLLILLMFIHYFSCIWWLIGMPPDSHDDAIDSSSHLMQYATTFDYLEFSELSTSSTAAPSNVTLTWSMYNPSKTYSVDLHTPMMNELKYMQYIYSAYWVINSECTLN